MWPKHNDEMTAREHVREALVKAFDGYRKQQHVANTWKVGAVPDALLDSLTAAAVTAVIDYAEAKRAAEAERVRPHLNELRRKADEAVAEVLTASKVVLG